MKIMSIIACLLFLGLQPLSAQKKALMTRLTQYLEIRNTVTDDQEAEVARIKSYLLPSKSPDSLAQLRYTLWKDELTKFGKDKDRVQQVQFLKNQTIAIVKTQKLRTYQIKRAKNKTKPKQVSFRFNYTWEYLDGTWYLRNVVQAENPKY